MTYTFAARLLWESFVLKEGEDFSIHEKGNFLLIFTLTALHSSCLFVHLFILVLFSNFFEEGVRADHNRNAYSVQSWKKLSKNKKKHLLNFERIFLNPRLH